MNYSVILTINALTSAIAILWMLRVRRNRRMLHQPRAVHLALPDPNAHRCEYVRRAWGRSTLLMCVICSKPPPTSLPGPGVRRLG